MQCGNLLQAAAAGLTRRAGQAHFHRFDSKWMARRLDAGGWGKRGNWQKKKGKKKMQTMKMLAMKCIENWKSMNCYNNLPQSEASAVPPPPWQKPAACISICNSIHVYVSTYVFARMYVHIYRYVESLKCICLCKPEESHSAECTGKGLPKCTERKTPVKRYKQLSKCIKK